MSEIKAVEYIPVDGKQNTLTYQGKRIEFIEGMNSLDLIKVFKTAYNLSPEAIFKQKDGTIFLIWDHSIETVLRPERVDESLWQEIQEASLDFPFNKKRVTKTTIDIESIWKKNKLSKDSIKLFIKALVKELKPSTVLILKGEIPNLPLLVAMYISRPYGKGIFFEDNYEERIRIFS